jgi:hypothetical protein
LGHAGSGRKLDLREAQSEAPFADGATEQVGTLGLGSALTVHAFAAPAGDPWILGQAENTLAADVPLDLAGAACL